MSSEQALQKQEPKAPATVKQWLESDHFKAALKKSLPSHMTPERFVRVALTTMMKVPKLAQCSQESLFKVMLDLSSLGLEPDGRRAHIIPYNNKRTGKVEAQLIIDYKGLLELAKRSGDVTNWRAEIVCEQDGFSWENGIVYHSINFRSARGKMQAVYSHVKTKDGIDDYDVMTYEQVEAIRKRSKTPNDGPWVTDFAEMAKKTVMRRHSKRLTLSPEFNDALVKDADHLVEAEDLTIEDLMPKRVSELDPIEVPVIDAEHGEKSQPEVQPENVSPAEVQSGLCVSEKQLSRLFAIASQKNITKEVVSMYAKQCFGIDSLKDLNRSDYNQICEWAEKGI